MANAIGAIVSVAALIYVGTRSGSNAAQPVVMVLIAIWVISPFVILFALHKVSASWSSATRSALYVMMLIISVLSLVVYLAAAAGPARPKPAAPFVALPPVAWVIIAIALLVAAFVSRSKQRESNRVSPGDER